MNLIIFDCDGTIVDSQHGIVAAMEATYGAIGLASPSRADILSIVGLSLPEVFLALSPHATDAVRTELSDGYKQAFMGIRTAGHEEALYHRAREVIMALAGRGDTVLAIATGKSIRGVDRVLTQQAWHGLFASIQTADTNPSKPHPGMIRSAVREVTALRGAAPRHVVMIGDTTYDMAMARAAGVHALGVAWGYHPVSDLTAAGAAAIAATFDDVAGLVDAMCAADR